MYNLSIDLSAAGGDAYLLSARSQRTGRQETRLLQCPPGHKLLEAEGKSIAVDDFLDGAADLPGHVQLLFGQRLFEWLFQDGVRDVVQQEFTDASQAGKTFRMLVGATGQEGRIPGCIPFEFLTDRVQNGFWFRRPTCTLVRRLVQLPNVTRAGGRRLLLLVSNPKDSELVRPFDDALVDTLSAQMELAGFSVEVRRELTFDALQGLVDAISPAQTGAYPWVHFLGHGAVDQGVGVLCLEDGSGGVDKVTGARLAPVFARLGTGTVFLQACFGGTGFRPYSGVAQSLLSQAGVALGIAALSSVSAKRSTAYACRFYNQMRLGRDIDAARQLALSAYPDDDAEWGLISLFARTDELAHEFLTAPWELKLDEDASGSEKSILLTGPKNANPLRLAPQHCEELKSARELHAKTPSEESAGRLSKAVRNLLPTADVLPPLEFRGDVAFRGCLSLSSYPWEQLPHPTPGQPLVKRDGLFVVREVSDKVLQGTEAGASGAVAICLSPDPEDGAAVKTLVRTPYDSVTIKGALREAECACLVLTVRVEEGRPQVSDRLRGRRAMRDTDLLFLRDRIWWKPAKLIILDLVGKAEIGLSVEGGPCTGAPLSLVRVLLDQAFGEVVLAPAISVDSAEWRLTFLEACTKMVQALEAGACLRNAMARFDTGAISTTLPTFCASNSFRRTL